MSLLNQVLGPLLGHGDDVSPAPPAADFIYLKIPMAHRDGQHVTADQAARDNSRLAHLEVALVEALHANHLGSLISAGDSLGEVAADGFRHLAHRRLDLEVTDLAAARDLLHRLLPELGAPIATELHYTGAAARRLQDTLTTSGWRFAEVTR